MLDVDANGFDDQACCSKPVRSTDEGVTVIAPSVALQAANTPTGLIRRRWGTASEQIRRRRIRRDGVLSEVGGQRRFVNGCGLLA